MERASSKRIGVWIDHAGAWIVDIERPDAEARVDWIDSGVERTTKSRGGTAVRRGEPTVVGASHRAPEERRRHELTAFYDRVIESLEGAEAIALLGPGVAKLELEKRMPERLADRIADRETVGKLSQPQVIAAVRRLLGASAPRRSP